ncbi:14201_t:CDS:1, partial [Racocetra fulgida]
MGIHIYIIYLLFSATEFQTLLEKYPPQVSSRETASQWACAIHNIVNVRLEKEIFDCSLIADKYKCGCDDEKANEIDDFTIDSTVNPTTIPTD